MRPHVHKLGGASLADAASIQHAVALLRTRPGPVVVVVSAMAGVTEQLLTAAQAAAEGNEDALVATAATLAALHRRVCDALVPAGKERQALRATITRSFRELESFALDEGTRERDNLPDLIKMVLYCRIGVARAELIEPTHARSMRIKFDRLLVAMKYKDLNEIDRLIEELLPDVHTYANQSTTTAQINTGIK